MLHCWYLNMYAYCDLFYCCMFWRNFDVSSWILRDNSAEICMSYVQACAYTWWNCASVGFVCVMCWTLWRSGPPHRTTAMMCLIVNCGCFSADSDQARDSRVTNGYLLTYLLTYSMEQSPSYSNVWLSISRDTYYCDWDILLVSLISTVRCSYSTLMPAVRCSCCTWMPAVRCSCSTLMSAVRCSYSTLMSAVRCLMPAVRCSYSTLIPAVRCSCGTLMSVLRCSYSTVVFKLSKGKWQIVSQVVFYRGFVVHLH